MTRAKNFEVTNARDFEDRVHEGDVEMPDMFSAYERISGEEFDKQGKPLLIGTAPTERTLDDAETFEEALDIALSHMRKIMIAKQRKYGPDAVGSELSVAIRMRDKTSRLNTMLGKNDKIVEKVRAILADESDIDRGNTLAAIDEVVNADDNGESIEDTWLDGANYGVIGYLYHNGAWGLPFASDKKDRFIELDVSDVDEGNVY